MKIANEEMNFADLPEIPYFFLYSTVKAREVFSIVANKQLNELSVNLYFYCTRVLRYLLKSMSHQLGLCARLVSHCLS